MPLEYDVTAVLRLVEQAVPRTFGSMDSVRSINGDARKHYAFEATRGPFTAFASGREMHLRATFAYEARGYYKPRLGPTLSAGCGSAKERPRIVVELATPLSLTEGLASASPTRVWSRSSPRRPRVAIAVTWASFIPTSPTASSTRRDRRS